MKVWILKKKEEQEEMEEQQQKKKKKKNMIEQITLLDHTSMGISHVKGVLRRTVCSE